MIREVCTSQVLQPMGKEREIWLENQDKKEAVSSIILRDLMENAPWSLPSYRTPLFPFQT